MADGQDLKETLLASFFSLGDFQFTIGNPAFWIAIAAVFLILLKFWQARKCFSFSVVLALLLLAETKADNLMAGYFNKEGTSYDPLLIRAIFFGIILFVFFYYAWIRRDE